MLTFQDSIESTCKLDKPKISKRTLINNPWITNSLINSIEIKQKLYKKWSKSKTHNIPNGNTLFHTEYQSYRKILKSAIKTSKASYYHNKFEQHKGDPKKTWQIINQLRGKSKTQVKPSFVVDGHRIVCRRTIANKFNQYFTSIAGNLNVMANDNIIGLSIQPLPSFESYLSTPHDSTIYVADTTDDEITDIINEFHNNKSSDIPIIVIKKCSHIIVPYITPLYNTCMQNGIFPHEFKTGKITPVYKKENSELLENYRPVSTLPIFGKIFEKIIYTRLYSFVISKGMLNENQFGFRKGHGTSHAIHQSVNMITNALSSKKHVLGIFIDLSKAFDTLDHNILLHKLNNYGIRGKAYDLIHSYISDRHQYVCMFNENSETCKVEYGVPQGSVLGPLLFLLYINDIINVYNNANNDCKFILYADDTNIFIIGNTRDSVYIRANLVLKLVRNYMYNNLLHINMSKCVYMYFEPKHQSPGGSARTTPHISYNNEYHKAIFINGVSIKRVHETKFLGVIIDDKLSWKPHADYLHKKLKSACGIISRLRHNIPKQYHKTLYHSLVESHINYGITVWGGTKKISIDKLFNVQKHCIRITFGDYEAYVDKYSTCARAREYHDQILSGKFYRKEHTKKLFNDNAILTIHNLYILRCCTEIFKILKFRIPVSIYYNFNISRRKNRMLLIAPIKNHQFLSKGTTLWNIVTKILFKFNDDFSAKFNIYKTKLKQVLFKNQSKHDPDEWTPTNFQIYSYVK